MAYLKKSIQRLNDILDEEMLPDNWNKFIGKASESENILIKCKNKHLYCTNCKKEYEYTTPPKKSAKCRFCHQKLDIKTSRIKKLKYNKNLILVSKVENEFVLRIFDLESEYNDFDFKRDVVEFGRYFIKSDTEAIKNNVCAVMGSYYVNHKWSGYNKIKWRAFGSWYKRLSKSGQVYHYNLKELFKGTDYQYSQMWELAKHSDYLNMANIFEYARYYSCFELLVKAKLYNLASEAKEFNLSGTFENRFGVSKSLYHFMKKYNINYKELERLRIYKKPNITKVRYLTEYSIEILKDIMKYISLDKFIDYSKRIKNFDEVIYCDYLRFCYDLGFNMKDKKILYPRTKLELDKKHDELEKQYEVKKDKIINQKIKDRFNQLKDNIFKDKQFIIKPASSYNELVNEGNQQRNCVRTYAEKYANNECDIYFMRDIKTPKKSLVTIEVRNNKVVQKRIVNNGYPTNEELNWLDIWEERMLNKNGFVD